MAQNNAKKTDSASLIDQNLKKVYDELVSEEVPDRFKNLLEQLKKQDSGSGDPQ